MRFKYPAPGCVKGSGAVSDRDTKGLSLLSEGIPLTHKLIVSTDTAPRQLGDILVLPWPEFLTRLWDGTL